MKGLTFTFSIIAAVILTLIFPEPFVGIGEFKFKIFIIPLLQIIMFGMGSTMKIGDFDFLLYNNNCRIKAIIKVKKNGR
jgi:BASS family bile acid:Na+ symporter